MLGLGSFNDQIVDFVLKGQAMPGLTLKCDLVRSADQAKAGLVSPHLFFFFFLLLLKIKY